MTSGPVVVMVLEKENAIAEFRTLIGNTDPQAAPTGSIRKIFGQSKTRNAIHGSDSDENALREIHFSSAKGKSYRNLTVFLSLKQKSTVE